MPGISEKKESFTHETINNQIKLFGRCLWEVIPRSLWSLSFFSGVSYPAGLEGEDGFKLTFSCKRWRELLSNLT